MWKRGRVDSGRMAMTYEQLQRPRGKTVEEARQAAEAEIEGEMEN